MEHTAGDGGEMFKAVCKLGLEGIVSKKLDAPYRSGPTKRWLKIKNPNAPAATRAMELFSYILRTATLLVHALVRAQSVTYFIRQKDGRDYCCGA